MASVYQSSKPCFLCGRKEKTVEVKLKNGSFSGVLCLEHLYDRLEGKPKNPKKPKNGAGKTMVSSPSEASSAGVTDCR